MTTAIWASDISNGRIQSTIRVEMGVVATVGARMSAARLPPAAVLERLARFLLEGAGAL